MKYLPISLNVDDRRIVVIGNGQSALSKLQVLTKTTAELVVFADQATPELTAFAAANALTLIPRTAERHDLDEAVVVYLADTDILTARRVRQYCVEQKILVNVVDDAASSNFISPAIVDRDPLVVAISTEGTAPVLARSIKQQLEALLDVRLGAFCQVAAKLRPLLRSRLELVRRRGFWRDFFHRLDATWLDAIDSPKRLRAAFDQSVDRLQESSNGRGSVRLVGAGPGDPELLTMKARQELDRADVVLYDRLVDTRILDLARREAQFIAVGKALGGGGWSQDEINAALIEHAEQGLRVVRLKSGDPLVFGRADEEIDALEQAGIEYQIVPGISAAIAAAANIGRSLTKRGRNSALTFLTGHDFKGFAEHNWRALAEPGQTAAIYMGVRAARFCQGRLLLAGAAPNTPITVVENASRPEQRTVATTLGNLTLDLSRHNVKGPAIIFLGLTSRKTTGDNNNDQATNADGAAMFASEFVDPQFESHAA